MYFDSSQLHTEACHKNMNKGKTRSSLQAVTICLSVLILKSGQCSALECSQTGEHLQ